MDRITIVLLSMLALVALLTFSGVYSEAFVARIRRRAPSFSLEGDVFLMWGLVLVAAFGLGLVVMYLLLTP